MKAFIRRVATDLIPDPYERKKDWGTTKRVFDGWHVKLDGVRLKTKRQWREANHGTWKHYWVRQIDPDQNLLVEIRDLEEIAPGRLRLKVRLDSRIDAFARIVRWRLGVQTFSLSVEATAAVRVEAICQIDSQLDYVHIPPDVVVDPTVTSVDVQLHDFQVTRISKIHGDLAREMGRGLRRFVEQRLEREEGKLVDRLNRQLDKQSDRLRFSLHDWASKRWADWIGADSEPTE